MRRALEQGTDFTLRKYFNISCDPLYVVEDGYGMVRLVKGKVRPCASLEPNVGCGVWLLMLRLVGHEKLVLMLLEASAHP